MFSFTIIFSYNKQEPLLLNERHALSTKQKSKWRFNDESKYTWENNEWQNMSGLVGAVAPLNLSIFVCTGKPTWTPSMLTTSILYFKKMQKRDEIKALKNQMLSLSSPSYAIPKDELCKHQLQEW